MILPHAQKRFKQRHGITLNKNLQATIFHWIRLDDRRIEYIGPGGNHRSKYNLKFGRRDIPIVTYDDKDIIITALPLGAR